MAPKISAACLAEYQRIRRAKLIVSLASLNGCGEGLQTDGDRIQREIEEYRALSQQVTQFTNVISESMEKIRASVDRPQRGPREKEDRIV
jgi:hypothetical protein